MGNNLFGASTKTPICPQSHGIRIDKLEEWLNVICWMHAIQGPIQPSSYDDEHRVAICEKCLLALDCGEFAFGNVKQSLDERITKLEKSMYRYLRIDKFERLIMKKLVNEPGALAAIKQNSQPKLERARHASPPSIYIRVSNCEKCILALEIYSTKLKRSTHIQPPTSCFDQHMTELEERMCLLSGDMEGIDLP
jgi:hypothetical protein